MFLELKRKYNRWLFKKYGFERGLFFEKLPFIWRVNPLFSPSMYAGAEGEQIAKWFVEGIEKGLKETKKTASEISEIVQKIQTRRSD